MRQTHAANQGRFRRITLGLQVIPPNDNGVVGKCERSYCVSVPDGSGNYCETVWSSVWVSCLSKCIPY